MLLFVYPVGNVSKAPPGRLYHDLGKGLVGLTGAGRDNDSALTHHVMISQNNAQHIVAAKNASSLVNSLDVLLLFG